MTTQTRDSTGESAVRPRRILVVEDHVLFLHALRDLLEMNGYSVMTAENGVEGLAAMEQVTPDLIIADIMMPQMDGYAFYEAVRARPAWVPIPFIFLTAKADREDILKGKELGAEEYLTKPFDSDELIVAVQSRLARAEEIQASSAIEFERLKQQIVTAFSHEMRTPLTYVRGYTELALEGLPGATPGDVEPLLRGIKHGADRLTRLVDDLLFLVRMDSGRVADEYRSQVQISHDVGQVILRAAEQSAQSAAELGLVLETHIDPGLPPVWLCGPLFEDALGRLIENGIKFSRGGGKRVTVDARASGQWVEIAVRDEGLGISADELPHLFERLRQIDRSRLEQQGLGLGLAISRELIRLHNGDITVESALGVGSTFTVRIPVAASGLDTAG